MMKIEEKINYVSDFISTQLVDDREFTSQFWRDILNQRENYPDANKIVNFLSNGSVYGYGDNKEQETQEKYERFIDSLTPETPITFLQNNSDPDFGGADKFSYNGVSCSMVYLQNLPTTYRITQLPLKNKTDGIRVLEIGAGFGAVAYQLHKNMNIKKYTIVDLPQALFLSYFYLSENLDASVELTAVLPQDHENQVVGNKLKGDIQFALPNQLAQIDGGYDLIINTASMGEMDLSMVETYKSFIIEKLSVDGIFFSINTHGKSGITTPSQYLIDGLELKSILPWIRRSHNHLYDKLHYEIVQSKNDCNGEYTNKTKSNVDYTGRLMIIGVTLPIEEADLLYEKGLKLYLNGKHKKSLNCLSRAIDNGLEGFAQVMALFILTIHDNRLFLPFFSSIWKTRLFKAAPPIQFREIKTYISTPLAVYRSRKNILRWISREMSY